MNKPRIEYLVHEDNRIEKDDCGFLIAIFGHPRLGDIDTREDVERFIRTSRILHVFEDGEFETLNTIYVPRSA